MSASFPPIIVPVSNTEVFVIVVVVVIVLVDVLAVAFATARMGINVKDGLNVTPTVGLKVGERASEGEKL